MNRKSTFLALAATAVLGLAMLSGSADAKGMGGGHGGGGHGMGGHGMGGHGMGGHGMHGGGHGMHGHNHHFRPHWYVRHHYRPVWYGYGYGVRPTYYAATPVAGPCTCLSKEYTPQGAVLFKDRCTNEAAMNPPAQQTGEAESQQQTAQYQQQYVQPQPQNLQQPQR